MLEHGRAWTWARSVLLRWDDPLWSAVIAMIVYAVIASRYGSLWRVSKYGYFNYLADAFLNGQITLRVLPQSLHDLSVIGQRYYLYWPPFPAVLLMPFVAIWGPNFSDVAFTIVLGGVNVALVVVLLKQACAKGIVTLTPAQRSLLVLGFALGSTHTALAPYGRVWYTAQLIGFACVLLAYLATITLRGWRAFAGTGIALAAALLTRNHLVLAGVWPAYYLLTQHWTRPWRRLLGYALAGVTPVVIAVALLGIYNALRFGSPFNTGLAYHQMAQMFRSDYNRYGAFNLYYLPTNVFYQYIAYPFPWRSASTMGGSLFLLSPVFFAAFSGIVQGRPRWSIAALVASIVLVAIPILLLMGTGWQQFGPRYTLDFTVPLLLLTALGVRRWPNWVLALATVIGVVQYIVGALYLGRLV